MPKCIDKQDRYIDPRICEMLPSLATVEKNNLLVFVSSLPRLKNLSIFASEESVLLHKCRKFTN